MSGFYRLVGADGRPAFHPRRAGEPLPEGAMPVDRMPGPFEDYVDGEWVTDARGLADWQAGPAHIAEAHALKHVEALLIEAGVRLRSGLLVEEAAALGLDPKALAASVVEKRRAFVAAEVNRQLGQAGRLAAPKKD